MVKAPIPIDEEKRLEILREYQILDTAAEKVFDDITSLAAEVCKVPICVLSFVDEDRSWFKSTIGLLGTEIRRELSFCGHVILQRDVFVVPDAHTDARFADHPYVTGEPHLRFYAGIPLVTPEGEAVGSLCVVDRVPRNLSSEQIDKIQALAQSAIMLLEVRRARPLSS